MRRPAGAHLCADAVAPTAKMVGWSKSAGLESPALGAISTAPFAAAATLSREAGRRPSTFP